MWEIPLLCENVRFGEIRRKTRFEKCVISPYCSSPGNPLTVFALQAHSPPPPNRPSRKPSLPKTFPAVNLSGLSGFPADPNDGFDGRFQHRRPQFGIFENSFDVDTFVAKPVNVYMFVHLVPKKVEALLDLSLTVGPPPP